jgi:hypothetical protein
MVKRNSYRLQPFMVLFLSFADPQCSILFVALFYSVGFYSQKMQVETNLKAIVPPYNKNISIRVPSVVNFLYCLP